MIRRFWLLAIFLLWVPSAHAGAPARLAVMLKEKMSCREVKRLLRIERLFIQCDAKQPMARNWTAHYFGKESLPEVLRELSLYEKVERAELGT